MARLRLQGRAAILVGTFVYLLYGVHKSHVGRGIVDVPELDPNAPQVPVPPMPGASTPGEDNG